MLRRLLFRSLVLAGILLACFAHLVWNGWHAKKVVAENLPQPLLSSGKRDIDLWHPTASFGHVYDLSFRWPEDRPWSVPNGSRLQVQVASNGRTRLLVVRPGHPRDSPTWWDVLRGRVPLQIVADREWVDLGPFPSGTQLDVQICGLLPGPFGFAEQNQPGTEHFSAFRIRRPDSPRARPSRTIVRYRFLLEQPVPAGETLTRFFFFISCSRVLQVVAVLAFALLFSGWFWLFEKRHARAVACLVPAVTFLHVCCLAPFQGADEATHAGTVEAVVWNPALFANPESYPTSLRLLYDVVGYDRWARYPDIPVSIDSPERRARVREVAVRRHEAEARTGGPPLTDALLIDPRTRAPLYYNAFRIPGPLLRRMSVLDRLEAYVVLSAGASLLFFGLGLLVLLRFGLRESLVLLYGLVALIPYSVGVVASCSNYSLAIGMGQFLAACLVGGVLSDSLRGRLSAATLFTTVSLIGIGVWDDFVFFGVPSTVVLTLLATHATYRMPAGSSRRLAMAAMLSLGTLLVGTVVYALATGRIRHLISSFGARLPTKLGRFEDPSFWLLLAAAAAPIVAALTLALAIVRSPGISQAVRERAAQVRSIALAVFFVLMFLVTPWTSIPFENVRYDYPDEIAAHWSSFWSNNFAFDQDVLSWKMYWGVFGYADVSYPDVVYAIARWTCVGLFLALPILSWRFTQRSPDRSAALLLAFGYALSACVVTNSLRYFAVTNPWGRFLLPAAPLVFLPLLARMDSVHLERMSFRIFAGAVALHIWTDLTLLGSRYAVGY